MQVSIEEIRPYLQDFDFKGLFVDGLGWNHYQADPVAVRVNNREYSLKPIAEKAGFVVYECDPSRDGKIPQYPIRRKIEHEVTKRTFEHLVIFADEEQTTQIWQWVKRESGKPTACREQLFHAGQGGDPLLQRLGRIAFTLDEEPGLNISTVTSKVRKALDVEKVTRHFYERFRTELTVFGSFIDGITTQGDRDWYASLMLNRMMFVYFVQKQGFLDSDLDYLRNRLCMVRNQSGDGRFQQFYRIFLLRLFHEGLGQPEAQRAPELAALLGKVPFLNGGLFDVHDLERDNPDISIPDEAFERVFDFFDGYRWHLDERPHREDNEINPDVLGYIFEKYVNQKQMGAYYTKEDITGYISRNTVVPFLFDAARKKCPEAFGSDGGVWRLLRDDPDRYIYAAVGHGVTWNAREAENPARLDTPIELPDDIAAGIDDVSQRGGWNSPAPDDYALPTETWREVVARRQRHAEVSAKIASGGVQDVNDLITLNLDIEQFAKDVISQSEGPEFLRAFWHAMRDVSVLDPTCGSGAFLFAALNVLEPLYTACLEGMRGFLDDLERSQRPHHPKTLSDFRAALGQVDKHPSERYFILKSIVLHNLYGVDIMEEAVEICKLRLFLKLVAQLESYDQIEPLPDIDFNVRAGNTLVGFTSLDAVRQAMTVTPDGQHRVLFPEDQTTLKRIEEETKIASVAFNQFRRQQTMLGGEVTAADKANLRRRLQSLDDELDRYLATEYGVDLSDSTAYNAWRASHQPFHWFVEFYGVMNNGGFDVVIGNPPYVQSKSVPYHVSFADGFRFPDVYAYVAIQSHRIRKPEGRCGLIVPLSLTFSFEFSELRESFLKEGAHWLSSFDNIPAALFSGVSQRCTIWITHGKDGGSFVTRLIRWRSAFRSCLLHTLAYSNVDLQDLAKDFGIPRLTDRHGSKLLQIHSSVSTKGLVLDKSQCDTARLGFSPTARNFISTYIKEPPVLDASNLKLVEASQSGWISLSSKQEALAALAVTSGDTCFWYWLTRGDGFHITNRLLTDILAPLKAMPISHLTKLAEIGDLLHQSRHVALVFKKNSGKYVGNYNYQKLLPLTRRADLILLSGLGASWADFTNLVAHVALVRCINEGAGEKNIPDSVRDALPVTDWAEPYSYDKLKNIDCWIATEFSTESRIVREAVEVDAS